MSRQRFPLLGECVALELVNTLVGGELELLCTAADTHRWLQAHSDQLPEGALLNPPQPRALRALRTAIGLGALDGGVNPVQESLAMRLDGFLDPADVDQVVA